MLRTKLFRAFTLIVVLFGTLSAVVGVRTIQRRVVREAQERVQLDLGSVWAVYNNERHQIETVLRMVAIKQLTGVFFESQNWKDEELRSRLERIRVSFGLHFLDLINADGQVVMRTSPPYRTGDYRASDAAVMLAMKGDVVSGTAVLSRQDMEHEADGLAEKAFLEVEDTPHARRSEKPAETRGMALVAAVPVQKGATVIGVVYGGTLINRSHDLIDRIQGVVFRNDESQGAARGTATIFLDDVRVATTVRGANGNRAIGTRVSKEVADRVLDNGLPWVGEAFVVRETYLSAYEAIRSLQGEVIGMLYVGIPKRPFEQIGHSIVMRYLYVSLFALVVALVLSFIVAGRIAQPIHKLVQASNRLSEGHSPLPVTSDGGCGETAALIKAFNEMTRALAEREEKLKALNRSYMETLGFVAHELKSPVATIMNYVYLLRERKLGEVNERQEKAIRAIDAGSLHLVEMVRHYLNLSRIENGELDPVRNRMALLEEVVHPILEAEETRLRERNVRVDNRLAPEIVLDADVNMVREVFDNLVSNAIKYGRADGCVLLDGQAAGDFVEFRVRNDGAGIPPEKMDSLFQKFSRLENNEAARREKGTGLGLFITKHIVEAHGGTIRAVSQPGEWVEFVFTLPAWRKNQTLPPAARVRIRAEKAGKRGEKCVLDPATKPGETKMPVREEPLRADLRDCILKWKDTPGSLVMVLHRLQEEYGYIPRNIAFEVANLLDIPLAKVYGVLTFYNFFKLKKPGRHRISVCMGTACYLRGSEDLIKELGDLLGVGINATTDDGEFSLQSVRCLGCCGLAPVLTVDGDVYGNVKKEDLAGILAIYKDK